MQTYSTEQIEMLTSDINVKFKRHLGYLNRKEIENSKLLNLSDDIHKQYIIDNQHEKHMLKHKLQKIYHDNVTAAKQDLKYQEVQGRTAYFEKQKAL